MEFVWYVVEYFITAFISVMFKTAYEAWEIPNLFLTH